MGYTVYKEYVRALSKVIFYLLQDGCTLGLHCQVSSSSPEAMRRRRTEASGPAALGPTPGLSVASAGGPPLLTTGHIGLRACVCIYVYMCVCVFCISM